jgi:hypothetical protein
MSVLALTVFVGFVLAGLFTALFCAQACGPNPPSERDALLPLESETTTRNCNHAHAAPRHD